MYEEISGLGEKKWCRLYSEICVMSRFVTDVSIIMGVFSFDIVHSLYEKPIGLL